MKRALLFSLLVLWGCRHTRPADLSSPSTRAEISARAERGQVVVTLEDGRNIEARDLALEADMVTGVGRRSGEGFAVPTSSVTSVEFLRDGLGALEGGVAGMAAGAAAFTLFSALDDTPAIFPGVATVVGSLTGGFVGTLVGLFRSDRVIYRPQPTNAAVLEVASAPCPGLPLACAVLEGE